MGFTGNELLKAAQFLHLDQNTGLFIIFLLLSAVLAFFSLAFTYLFIDTPMSGNLISKKV
tara:strand:- start:79 stop:258 length:180 start_codon:yes stop_codon:yes gene_type:complete